MTAAKFRKMSTLELVKEFEALCLAQYHSLEREEISQYNKRYKLIETLENEMKSRPGDQRRVLQQFYKHPNLQVCLTAAHATLALDYKTARHVIERIAESKWNPQAGDAGMSLLNLDRGVYRPT